ncbi:ThiF family adenylyltransferase [Elizabethkingia meningoseptica]|uniref:ThiF family adenylyltransferase n=1 Tax=Elizabethkingia meningoseptica TaxID=238 RepID=UPI002DD624B4|nr:ThiF family adenylyltransferase [Elizabethkingia meningoseptica]MEC4712386.1 ThiF family adenylyltransferase [Elizabethkingia meningoseptica]
MGKIVLTADNVEKIISQFPFVRQVYFVKQGEFNIEGKIEIAFEGLIDSLNFDFMIRPQYPLKCYDSESIKFINHDLLEYNHVMKWGEICIHTSHSTNLEEKLSIDFNALKGWIERYYIGGNVDSHYEHIIVQEDTIDDKYYSYCFTDCDGEFVKGEFGTVSISPLGFGIYKEKILANRIVQMFSSKHNNIKRCQWSNIYQANEPNFAGVYYFMETPPATHGKFIFENWIDLSGHLSSECLEWLREYQHEEIRTGTGKVLPLFLGYKINDDDIHWQVAIMEIGKFPIAGIPERKAGIKTGRWSTGIVDGKIIWGLTRNISYKYFFGRGTFGENLVNKKILVIGVGAVGSMLATTLTRGGCKYIDLIDHDTKEYENVCRSEYMFSQGITNKVLELRKILSDISPFVNIEGGDSAYIERGIKAFYNDKKYNNTIEEHFDQYDLIFDCTTDNDLMFVLESLNLEVDILNISITNHAKEMVCAFYPNMYRFVNNQFSNVLKNNVEDLYNPTGCWNPTFKASYNDINVLVQLALKHVNYMFSENRPRNNFVIKEDNRNLKIVEF